MALERVLLAIPPADRAHLEPLVDAVVELTAGTAATVYLLYLFPDDDFEAVAAEMDVDPTTDLLSPDELAARHDSVQLPASRLTEAGIEHEVRGVAGGDPAEQVVKRVEELAADVVVVGGTRRSPTGKAMFGDTAQQVLLNAPCPVLYVKRE
ncbi:universal stress protein [Haloarcula marina]|uniref:universal stress protein n=1 Tax=Haloarcula marina TaxID=2961574 RepID=UPI0020B7A17C|nr:universal stress protein [Halomicroarcula marina]